MSAHHSARPAASLADLVTERPAEATVETLLSEVIDPELGINIVDLGLVREIAVAENGAVGIVMTLTTPACPLGPYIVEEINEVLGDVWPAGRVDVSIVWSPAWDPDRDMTDHAKELLGWRS